MQHHRFSPCSLLWIKKKQAEYEQHDEERNIFGVFNGAVRALIPMLMEPCEPTLCLFTLVTLYYAVGYFAAFCFKS